MGRTVNAAAVYCRISQDRAGEGLGVERQEDMCRRLAETKGWPVAEVYVDNDLSAYRGKPRPGYDRLLEDIQGGRRDAVLCVDLDRLTRHPAELEAFVTIADTHAVALANVSGDVDLSTSDGRFRARILGAVARMESEKKSERLRRQREQAATKGTYHGGRRAFGYARDGLTLEPAEAKLILEAVDRVLAGESLRSIAWDWNERGIATTGGGRWHVTTLRTMLTGPRLAGRRVFRGEDVGPAEWPAIIDTETHARLRAIIGDPRRRQKGRPPTSLLGGMLRCGRCGGRLHASTRTNGARRYMCGRSPGTTNCGRLAIAAEPLEEEVVERVLDALDTPGLVAAVAGDTETAGVSTEIARLEDELASLAEQYGAGTLTQREWLAARDGLQTRLEALRSEAAPPSLSASEREVVVNLRERWPNLDTDTRRSIIGVVIEHVEIAPATKGSRFDPDRVRATWRV